MRRVNVLKIQVRCARVIVFTYSTLVSAYVAIFILFFSHVSALFLLLWNLSFATTTFMVVCVPSGKSICHETLLLHDAISAYPNLRIREDPYCQDKRFTGRKTCQISFLLFFIGSQAHCRCPVDFRFVKIEWQLQQLLFLSYRLKVFVVLKL